MNSLQSWTLIAAITAVLGFLGYVVAGTVGAVVLGGLTGLTLWLAPRPNTRRLMDYLGARPLRPGELPSLWQRVAALSRKAGLDRVPRLFTVDTNQLNAAAMGSERDPLIVVSTGLLRRLSERELTGVLAHEISHLANRDLRTLTLANRARSYAYIINRIGLLIVLFNLFIGIFGVVAHVSWLAIGAMLAAPMIVGILSLSLSRAREYHADMSAVALTGDPVGLASALRKLELAGHTALENLFGDLLRPRTDLLMTHPNTSSRIQRLLSLRWSSSSSLRSPSDWPVMT